MQERLFELAPDIFNYVLEYTKLTIDKTYKYTPDEDDDSPKIGFERRLDSRSGYTTLHLATGVGSTVLVEKLIKNGEEVDARDAEGLTSLHWAVEFGRADVIHRLIKNNAKIESQDNSGETPLHRAAKYNKCQAIVGLRLRGASNYARNKHGYLPIHIAAMSGSCDAIFEMVQLGADIDALTGDHNTALHLAVRNLKLKAYRVLLLLGANSEIRNNKNETPLEQEILKNMPAKHAEYSKFSDHVKKMTKSVGTEYGYDKSVEDILDDSNLVKSHDQYMQLLLRGIDACDENNDTPLHLVAAFEALHKDEGMRKIAAKHHLSICCALIEGKAKLDQLNNARQVPLHVAAEKGHLTIVQALLSSGAKVNMLDINGKAPLDLAVSGGHSMVAKELRLKGAKHAEQILQEQSTTREDVVMKGMKSHSFLASSSEEVLEKKRERGEGVDSSEMRQKSDDESSMSQLP